MDWRHLSPALSLCISAVSLLCLCHGVRQVGTVPDAHGGSAWNQTVEQALIQHLLSRIRTAGTPNVAARPVRNVSTPVQLRFGVELIQILEFDTKNQVISLLVWKHHSWIDEMVVWDPTKFGGLSRVVFPASSMWVPDIVLYNSINMGAAEQHTENLVLYSNGNVTWMPSWVYRSACKVDSTDFPFDHATCIFQFGMWTHSSEQVMLDLSSQSGFGLDNYINSTLWDLTDNQAYMTQEKYSCCPELYSVLHFNITLRRRAGFQLKILIIPAASLPLLTGCMFWIPPERPDRVGIGVSFFSAFFLLLLLLADYTPPEANSNFATFCGLNMMMIALAIVASVSSVNVSRRQGKPPRIVRTIILGVLGRVVCAVPLVQKPAETESRLTSMGPLQVESKPAGTSSWKTVTVVMDRLLFIFYLLGVTVVFVSYFPRYKTFHVT